MWTQQDEERLQHLNRIYGEPSSPQPQVEQQPTDDRGYFTGHLLPSAVHAVAKTFTNIGEGAMGLAELPVRMFDSEAGEQFDRERADRKRLINEALWKRAQSKGMLDTATDVILGDVAPEIAALMVPASAATKGAQLLTKATSANQLGTAANFAINAVTGLASGAQHGGEEAATQAGEFGIGGLATTLAGNKFGTLGRIIGGGLGNAAIATGGQMLRGNDLSSDESKLAIATQGLLPAGIEATRGIARRFGKMKTVDTSAPPPEPLALRDREPLGLPGRSQDFEMVGGVRDVTPDVIYQPNTGGNQGYRLGNRPEPLGLPETGAMRLQREPVTPVEAPWAPEPMSPPNLRLEGYRHIEPEIPVREPLSMRSQAAIPDEVEAPVILPPVEPPPVRSLQPVEPPVADIANIKAATPIVPQAIVPRYKLGASPQTYSLVEKLESTPREIELGEQYVKVKNERTGEVQTVLESELQPVGLRKFGKGQSGAIDQAAIQYGGGAIGGAIAGGLAADEDNRLQGATLGALAGLGIVGGARNLGALKAPIATAKKFASEAEEAATRNLKGKETKTGTVMRWLQKNVFTDDDILTHKEQAAGLTEIERKKVMEPFAKAVNNLRTLTPKQKDALVDYTAKKISKADLAAMGVKDDVIKFWDSTASADKTAKTWLSEASDDPAIKQMLANTDDYQTNAYRVDLDDKFKYDEANIQKVVDENMAKPEYKGLSRAEVEDDTRTYLASRLAKDAESKARGSNTRMAKSLYIPVKSLNESELGVLKKLENNPLLTSDENAKVTDILTNGITPEAKNFLKGLSQDPRINHLTMLKSLRDYLPKKDAMWIASALNKKIVPPEAFTMLDNLSKNPKLSSVERTRLNDLVNEARASHSRTFKTEEADAIESIAKRSITSEAHKDLLGLIRDPVERRILTTNKILNSMKQAVMLTKIKKESFSDGSAMSMQREDWSKALKAAEDAGDKVAIKKLTSDYVDVPTANREYGVISGAKIHRKIADALEIGAGHKGIDAGEGMLSMIASIPKVVHTRLSPAAWAHNAISSALQAHAMGVYNPIKAMRTYRNAIKDPAIAAEITRNGIAGGHAGTDMAKVANDIDMVLNPTGVQSAKQKAKAAWDWWNELYGKTDSVARVAGYIENKPRFIAKGKAKGLSGDKLDKFAEFETTKFVNKLSNNYGQVSKLTRRARNTPFVNPFLSYQTQNLKVVKNLAKDLLNGDSDDKKRAAIALTSMLIMPAVAVGGSAAMLSDDDKKEWEKVRNLSPNYMKARLQLPTGKNENGDITSINIQPWMPSGDIVAFARNLVNGDGESLLKSNPLFGIDRSPALNMASELITGRDAFTKKEFRTAGDYAHAVTKNLTPSFFPGNHLYNRVKAGLFTRNEEGELGVADPLTGRTESPATALAAAVGLSVSNQSSKRLFRQAKRDAEKEISDYRSDLKRVLRSNIAEEDKEEARQLFIKKREKVLRRLNAKIGS